MINASYLHINRIGDSSDVVELVFKLQVAHIVSIKLSRPVWVLSLILDRNENW